LKQRSSLLAGNNATGHDTSETFSARDRQPHRISSRATKSAKANTSRSIPKSSRPSRSRASVQSRSTSSCRRRKSTSCI